MDVVCKHCGALLFKGETSSRCCGNGQYFPAPQEDPPEYLRGLLTDDTGPDVSQEDSPQASDPVHFRANMRAYNLAFQFTSINCQEDQRGWRGRDHSWYQIHGQIFHLQGQLQPTDRDKAMWAQLYFYDPDHAAQRRMQNAVTVSTGFTPQASIMRGLHQMMLESNELVKVYMSAQQMLQTLGNDRSERHHIKVGLDMGLVLDSDQDQRRYNAPSANESVAAFLPDLQMSDVALLNEASETTSHRGKGLSLILRLRSPLQGQTAFEFIRHGHPAYMPLAYPLLFPYGKKTEYSMESRRVRYDGEQSDKSAQAMHHYSSRFHVRQNEFNTVLRGRRVTQQYGVDAWVAIESFRLEFIRYNQDKIRADTYQSIADQNARDVVDPGKVGSRVILPATARNSDRWMQQRYLDSMAIVGYFGKPTFFITFTANPLWPEITDPLKAMESGLKWIDGPAQVARVFNMKLQALLKDLKEAFGHQVGIVRTIEYQKRGVPHCHILLFIKDGQRIFSDPALVDQVICAEIPDPEEDPELYAVVTGQLMHGPCGVANPKMSCMKEGPDGKLRCSKGYPKEFRDETIMREDSYPDYRRRDNGWSVIKGNVPLSNQHVVPYNPYLTKKYGAHINVEILADVNAVKYIHKYVYKGVDKATMAIKDGSTAAVEQDEIKQYISGRWVGACQALWEIFSFKVHEEKPAVVRLAVHLPNQQSVIFNADNTHDWDSVLAKNAATTLTGWFEMNKEDADAQLIPYVRFPNHYVWNIRTKKWTRRQRQFSIGRLQHVMPQHADLYSLFVLLSSDTCCGAQSFEDLRTVNGQLFPTFRLAAQAKGLLPDGDEWRVFFSHVQQWVLGPRLRSLFVLAITTDAYTDAGLLWGEFREAFCDDLPRRLRGMANLPEAHDRHLDYGLYLIERELQEDEGGKTLVDVGLPLPQYDWDSLLRHQSASDTVYDPQQQASLFEQLSPQMNAGQRAAFQEIASRIADPSRDCIFFVQGPGGTGKSFLWKCLCAHYRAQEKVVLCVASSGIAALVLPGGRTAHSTFKIPLDTSCVKAGGVKAQSAQAELLRKASLIIWDEVPMQHRYNIHAVDLLLKDLRGNTKFFGGIPVIFGGDFAQIPPVVTRGRRADQVRASLRSDAGFQKIEKLFLWENMRLGNSEADQAYAQWLRTLPYTPSLYGLIKLPAMVRQVLQMEELHSRVFPLQELSRADQSAAWFEQRAILAPHNRTVDEHNSVLLELLPGQVQQFDAINSIQHDPNTVMAQFYAPAFLNTIKSNALQPGILRLKVGAPIILLRNLRPSQGLCNGTRLRVLNFDPKAIVATILGGDFDGDIVGIPRIDLNTNPDELPFIVTRRQFPVRLCFAMSINKSQGQSLSCVGVDLRQTTFTHGQLYVALSRVRNVSQLTVLLRGDEEARTYKKAENIVWPELLLPQPSTVIDER